MAKKTKITKEELKTYIPLRQVSTIYVPDEDRRLVPREFSANILVPPDDFPESCIEYSTTFDSWEMDDEKELAEYYKYRKEIESKYPTRFYILDLVPGIDPDKEIKDFTPEDVKRVFDYYKGEIVSDMGMISVSLSSAISQKKNTELLRQLLSEEKYINRKGKPVFLTPRQIRIVSAVSHYFSQFLGDKDVSDYIDKISNNPREGKNINPIMRSLNIRYFLEKYKLTSDGRVRSRDIVSFKDELKSISDIEQVIVLTHQGETMHLKAPLFKTLSELEISTSKGKNKTETDITINIVPSIVFFLRLKNQYFPLRLKAFENWGKKGNGTDTELYSVLFLDLASKWPIYTTKAKIITHRETRRQDFATKEEYLKEEKKTKRKYLTYDQNLSTLLEKVSTDYSSTRQYRYNLKKDLEKCIAFLIDEVGVITEGGIRKNAKGGEALRVVFNLDYNRGEEL